MKSIFIIALIVLNSALGFGQAAEFHFKESIHKFPETKEGVILEHNFTVINTGNIPLIFTDYKVECPCTKVVLPKKPIAPGETYQLKVSFDTKGKYYYQDRIIYLKANTKKGTHKIRIKANVVPANEPTNK